MVSVFRSKPEDCDVHPSGWWRLPSGVRVTSLPYWDTANGLFARLGHGPAGQLLRQLGLRLPTVAEYEELHRTSVHIDPYTLPTEAMLVAARVPKPWMDERGNDTPQMRAYRAAHIQSRAWCEQHDAEVWRRLDAVWDAGPVANAGKHWAQDGVLVGWWRRTGGRIQNPTRFHAGEPLFCGYSDTFHAVDDRDELGERPTRPEIVPPASTPGSKPTLRLTSPFARGEAVCELQRALGLELVDGVFGRGTHEAVRDFQRGRGLAVDGVVGPRTWTELLTQPLLPEPRGPTGTLPPALPAIVFKPARHFYAARRAGPPIWVVIHTAEAIEASHTAEALQRYALDPRDAKGNPLQISWHYACDVDSITQSVAETHTAFAAPGANARGIQIELAGYARQTADEWDDPYSRAQLELCARLVASICKRWGIPMLKVGPTEMRAGEGGICGHVDVTRGVGAGRTTHRDPGLYFPWKRFIELVESSRR